VCNDRKRGNGFKLKEALAQVAQRSCGCPLPGSVQDQVVWCFEQPGLVEDDPACDGRVGTR